MSDPLSDTLFRPTTLSPVSASSAPVRQEGTRSRAGNAMSRTRTALLAGAARAVQSDGIKITMAQVAAAAGVAKATLYNHFRTREAVLAGLLVAEVDTLIDEHASKPLAAALVDAAMAISEHPVRRALMNLEPAVVARIGRMDPGNPVWQRVRGAVRELLVREGRGGTDAVVRWLASFVVSGGDRAGVVADASVLLAGLPLLGAAEVSRPA